MIRPKHHVPWAWLPKKQKNWVTEPDRWLNIIDHLKASRMIFFFFLTVDLIWFGADFLLCLSGQRLTWRKEQYGPTTHNITWQVFFCQATAITLTHFISFIDLFIYLSMHFDLIFFCDISMKQVAFLLLFSLFV